MVLLDEHARGPAEVHELAVLGELGGRSLTAESRGGHRAADVLGIQERRPAATTDADVAA